MGASQAPASTKLPLRIQMLDDDATSLAMLGHVLSRQGWDVMPCQSIAEASSMLQQTIPDVAVVDVYLDGEDGLSFVSHLRKDYPDVGIVVISAEDTETLAKKAVKSGADYFLSKPIAPAALVLTLRRLAELRQERQRVTTLEHELERSVRDTLFPEIVTHSDSMRSILRLVEKVAPRELSVLICGESGTGKELVARAIHQHSLRSKGPFVELNCAALPPNLVESELFGHEKGAFTGAVASRAGKIELADGGTLFLDEIGELPLEIQPKLLRALQERRVTRVGGKEDIHCDFRLVTATNLDLLKEVRENNFREDLFYRVSVFPIKLPPLRERMEDMPMLLAHFLKQEGIQNPHISDEARAALQVYHWPGNIRELKNFSQAVPLLTDNELIDEDAVMAYFGSRIGGGPPPPPPPPNPPKRQGGSGGSKTRRQNGGAGRQENLHALRVYNGNVPEAALALGMGRATLYKYIKKNDITLENFTV